MFRHLLIILFVIICVKSNAQRHNFTKYNVTDGLVHSVVSAITEDTNGYIWAGTFDGGVSKFDGLRFTNYSQSNGLPSNAIQCIFTDDSGKIWFGTEEDGLMSYDGDDFILYNVDSGIVSNSIKQIYRHSDGNIWIATTKGINIINQNGIKEYEHNKDLTNNYVTSILEDSQGNTLIGTFNGITIINKNNEIDSLKEEDGLVNKYVVCLKQDSRGAIWIGTPLGISKYQNGKFENIVHSGSQADNWIEDIEEHPNGDIWVATRGGGVFIYNDKGFKQITDKEGLESNAVLTIYKDSSGILWLGTVGGGLHKYIDDGFTHLSKEEGLSHNLVFPITEDNDGQIWLGTYGGGINKYDPKTGEIKTYTVEDGLTGDNVFTIHKDKDNSIWLGTMSGLNKVVNGKFIQHPKYKDISIWSMIEGKKGETWIGLNSGVIRELDLNKHLYDDPSQWDNPTYGLGRAEEFKFLEGKQSASLYTKNDGFTNQSIFSMTKDAFGNIWFGSGGDGAFKYDGSNFIKYDESKGIASDYIICSILDPNGGMWFGTDKGVSYFQNDKFYNFTEQDGLSSNTINQILIDDDQNIWLGTAKGVDRLVIDEYNNLIDVSNYGKVDGFTSIETNDGSGLKDRLGNLWFGTIKGVTKIDPSKVGSNTKLTQVHISKILLFFDEVNWNEYSDSVTQWFHLPTGLTLPYNKNQLTFEFTGINMRLPEKIKYQWKLEGFDPIWSPVTDKYEANYTNIPPGDYTFLVKASNEIGIWNPEPASFHFRIEFPVWQRWWFVTMAMIIFISLLWGFIRYRINHINKMALVQQQALETERRMVESERKALRAQINPHFIFNVLNSIQFYIQDNDPLVASRYLSKFAKLMRMILENSKSSSVPLNDELEALKLYMDLEILRTEYKFEYSINIDQKIDASEIYIPPMLIQPFIENSIRHGIGPSTDAGHINIDLQLNDNIITCIIEDNGIGINASQKLNRPQNGYVSSGMKITGDRLEILNSQRSGHRMNVTITDLQDENKERHGTRVKIYIPVE